MNNNGSRKLEAGSRKLSGGEILSDHLVPSSGPSAGQESGKAGKREGWNAGMRGRQWRDRLFWILAIFLFVAPILSANDDGEILDASIVLTVSPDFKVKEEVSITKRLLSYQALDTDGDPRTPYCGALQTLTITKARVTTPSGKVVDCTPNALNLSTPDALVAHPELSSWQEMVVTFLGLEPGAQTELSYIREDKSAFRTTFEKKQILAWHFPIRKGTVTVRLPKDMALTYQIMNFKGESAASPKGDMMEYSFTFTEIPAFSDREMHNGMAFLPTLYLTTTPSWEAAGKRLQEIGEKYGAPDEAITKKAKELTKDATTDLDKAIAIHKFVKERFKEIEWPLQDSLLLFNDAGKTFAAGQGTNLELALLLDAMMRAAGFDPSLSFLGPPEFSDKAPGLMAFDRVVVSTLNQFGGDYIDPSAFIGSSPAERAVLERLIPAGYLEEMWALTLSQPLHVSLILDGSLEFINGTLSGNARLDLKWALNPYWSNLEQKDALEDAVKSFLPLPGFKIEETHVKTLGRDATSLEIIFSGKIKEGEHIVRLLSDTKSFLPKMDSRTTSMQLPVRLPDAKVSIRWTVKGAGMMAVPAWKAEGNWGNMEIERTQDGPSLMVDVKVVVKEGLLTPADYPGLQAALAAWQNPVVAGVLLP